MNFKLLEKLFNDSNSNNARRTASSA